MAIFPHTLCLASTFVCHQQEQAGVRPKRDHLHTPRPWSDQPYVRLEMHLGTHKTCLNRITAHHYSGHIPDAPVMLGGERTAAYRAGAAATTWGGGRGAAVGKAALVGAGLGVMVALGSIGVVALLIKLGAHGAMSWAMAGGLVVGDASLVGAVLAFVEARDYRDAWQRFTDLAELSDGYDRLAREEGNQIVEGACQRLVEKGYGGQEWSLRHAAAEYDAEMQAVRGRRAAAAEKAAA